MYLSLRGLAKCGILACLSYMQWYMWVFGEKGLILYSTAGLAIGCMIIDHFFNYKKKEGVFPYGCINNLVMCAYSLLTGLFVSVLPNVMVNATETLLAFSLTCLAFCYAAKDGFDWMINGIIAISVLASLWALFLGYYLPGYGMVLSRTNNPHSLGVVMNLGIFALAYRCKHNTKSLFIHLGIAALLLYTIIQCGSRKCIIAAMIIMAPWLFFAFKQVYRTGTSRDRWLITFFYIIIITAAVWYYLHEFVGSNSYERLANIEESQANQSRIKYYQLGFEFFVDSPVFGIGLGQFALRNPNGAYSHSTIIEGIASWGTVGSLLYFVPLLTATYRAIKLAFRSSDQQAVIIAALCIMELFLAFLQIFFYSFQHMIAWSIIFVYIHKHLETNKQVVRRSRYVKA